MKRRWGWGLSLAGLCALAAARAVAAGEPAAPPAARGEMQTLGLMRVRDMTPFGITRLDLLPAHAVQATPGTWAFEVTFSYQNTWALSENVKDYLAERGISRGAIGPEEIAAIRALPGDAYLVDGEFGVVDLTLHHRATRRLGLYATVPYHTFTGGTLDATIEGFHDEVGFSSAGREHVPRDRFVAVVDLERVSLALDRGPESDFGDPVFGVRWALDPDSPGYDVVFEAAAKLAVFGGDRLVSTGENDYGAQISLQRFLERNAFYLSLAGVWFQSPDPGLARDLLLPTAIAGWETRLGRNASLIVQGYASKSTVQETDLDELSAAKLQATIGVQWVVRGKVVRFGITENVANFDNTPDVGVSLSLGRILFGGAGGGR